MPLFHADVAAAIDTRVICYAPIKRAPVCARHTRAYLLIVAAPIMRLSLFFKMRCEPRAFQRKRPALVAVARLVADVGRYFVAWRAAS